jgi:hypothetical protein
MNGRIKHYQKILAAEFGEEWMERQKVRAKRVVKDSQIDFVKMRLGFEAKYKKLMADHGFETWGQLLRERR